MHGKYVQRFWDINTKFWCGLYNVNVHSLTTRQVLLKVQLNITNETLFVCTYNHFVVDWPEDRYTLHVGHAQGPNSLIQWLNEIMESHLLLIIVTMIRQVETVLFEGWWYCELTLPWICGNESPLKDIMYTVATFWLSITIYCSKFHLITWF